MKSKSLYVALFLSLSMLMSLGQRLGILFTGYLGGDTLPLPTINSFVIASFNQPDHQGQLTWTVTAGNIAIAHVTLQQSDDGVIDWLDYQDFTNPCNISNLFVPLNDGVYFRLKVYGDGLVRATGPTISGILTFAYTNQSGTNFTTQANDPFTN